MATLTWRDRKSWSLGANDKYKDCFPTDLGNNIDFWLTQAGRNDEVLSDAECLDVYRMFTGWDPTNAATDLGTAHPERMIQQLIANKWPADPSNTPTAYERIDDLSAANFTAKIKQYGALACVVGLVADESFGDDAIGQPETFLHGVLFVDPNWLISWARPYNV